jgi:hypothetical protein
MSLKKVAMWGLSFCAVAISPVILVYGVPFGIGIVSNFVQIGADQVLLCVVSAVCVGWVRYAFADFKNAGDLRACRRFSARRFLLIREGGGP